MTSTTDGIEAYNGWSQAIYEANLITNYLRKYKFDSLEITQFGDLIFIRPKGDSIYYVKILKKYFKIEEPSKPLITLQKGEGAPVRVVY